MRTIERHLQQCLNRIEDWATGNGFKFSKSKTQCVQNIPEIVVEMFKSRIRRVSSKSDGILKRQFFSSGFGEEDVERFHDFILAHFPGARAD